MVSNIRAEVTQAVHQEDTSIHTAVTTALGRVWTIFSGAVEAVIIVSKTPDALRQAVAGIVNLANAVLIVGPIQLTSQAIETATVVEDFISWTRIFSSLNYFISEEKCWRDIQLGRISNVVSEACFGCARIGLALLWFTEQQLFSLATLAVTVGNIPVLSILTEATTRIGGTPIVYAFFILGLIACIVDNIHEWGNGRESRLQTFADIINCAAEAIMLGLLLKGGYDAPLPYLGVIAASAGVSAYVIEKHTGAL